MIGKNAIFLAGCLAIAACAPKPNPHFKAFPSSIVTYKDSVEKIKAAADNGDVGAMNLLWGAYGIKPDQGNMTEEESNVYLFKAAEMGSSPALHELVRQYEQKIPPQPTLPAGYPLKMKWRSGFHKDYAKALYWRQRATCHSSSYYASYLAAIYGGLDAKDITPEERTLVEPNLILAHVHASMIPNSMPIFSEDGPEEELKKRMTNEQIEVADEIAEQFRSAPICPYFFENGKMVGLQLNPKTADKYTKTPKT